MEIALNAQDARAIAHEINALLEGFDYIEYYEGNYETVKDEISDNPEDYAKFVSVDSDPKTPTPYFQGNTVAYGFAPDVFEEVREAIETKYAGLATDYPALTEITWADDEITLSLSVFK